jgi:hypothetical protein
MRFFWYPLGLLWITAGLIGHIVQGYLPTPSRQVPRWLLSAIYPERTNGV